MKNDKTVKQVIGAVVMTGIVAISFVSCNSKKQEKANAADNIISAIDENNNPLSVMVLALNENFNDKEFYGYLKQDGNNLLFYDVLNDKTYDLNNDMYKKYDIYIQDLDEFLLTISNNKHQSYIINNGIEMKKLKDISRSYEVVYLDDKEDGKYALLESFLNGSEIKKYNRDTKYTDSENEKDVSYKK